MDAVAVTTADTAMIPAGSSSYCSCSAVADVDAETTAVAADVRLYAFAYYFMSGYTVLTYDKLDFL